MIGGDIRQGRDCHNVRGRTDVGLAGDLARLDARTDANGGHGNDRPTHDRWKRLADSEWERQKITILRW